MQPKLQTTLHALARFKQKHGPARLQIGSFTSPALLIASPPNYNGLAQFTYWVSDGQGGETPATVVLTLSPVNDLPQAQGEQMDSLEDQVLVFDPAALLANDSDVDVATNGQVLSWSSVGDATHGTVAWRTEADGSRRVVFTPEANYAGEAGFAYTVSDGAGGTATARVALTLAAVNDAPIAVDDRFATYRGSTMRVAYDQLLGNDRDLEGDALTLGAVRDNAHGQVSLVDGQVQFVPQAGYLGAAAFDYRVDDGQGGQTWATAFVDVKLPPNLYPTMSLSPGGYSDVWYGGSAYYNAVAVWQNFSYQINDESPGSVSFRFVEQVGELVAGSLGGSTFQFHVYDGWGADGVGIRFDVVLTDQEGITNTAHVQTGYDLGAIGNALRYFSITHDHSGLYVSPVVLDLDGNGVGFAPLATSGVALDVDADGVADRLAWAEAGDGVLVWDQDHDGRVSGVQEFSFQHLVPGAATDLQGLQALDSNANGLLDAGDASFADFALWRDANGNGQVDGGEFLSLAAHGIASIDLNSNAQWRDAGAPWGGSATGQTDVLVMGETHYTRTDGTRGQAADAMFAYEPGSQANPEAAAAAQAAVALQARADAQVVEVIRMALLFNQLCATAPAQDAVPLGFIPLQPDSPLPFWDAAADLVTPIPVPQPMSVQPPSAQPVGA